MGLFNFLRARATRQPASSTQNDLSFKSGKAAFDYVHKFMKTEWEPNSTVVALAGNPRLENGILSAQVLISHGSDCVALPTLTAIKAVHSKERGRLPINTGSNISMLGLKAGDLVTVLLAGRDAEYARLVPESDGWVAFIIGKNLPIYSLHHSGWLMERKYEM